MTERELANRERRRCWVRTVVDFCYSYDSDNVTAFCRERGISASTFNYWSNRIRLGLYEQGIEKGFFKEMRIYPTLPIMLDVLHIMATQWMRTVIWSRGNAAWSRRLMGPPRHSSQHP